MELRNIISALVEAADTCVDDRSGSPMQVAEWDEAIEAGRKWLANPENGKPVSCVCGACGEEVDEIIGCPNGIEVCQDCFNNTAAG